MFSSFHLSVEKKKKLVRFIALHVAFFLLLLCVVQVDTRTVRVSEASMEPILLSLVGALVSA